jgi:hypothetical protein
MYRVEWEIDIEADNPHEAAQKALMIQRRHGSSATVFTVFDESGHDQTVDLNAEHAGEA